MRVFFDVDLTLLHAEGTAWTLRPGAREVLARLREMGHEVYLWTATGHEHARRLVERFGLHEWVTDCFDKDPDCPVQPDLVVDDDPYLVEKYGGIWVQPYREPDPQDRELFRVLERLERWNGARPGGG